MFNSISRDDMVSMLARLGEAVPAGADLGYHCCYGNFNLKHFVEPANMGDMVDVMNEVMGKLSRAVQFIHMPVPLNRFDEGYFRPLENLRCGVDCEIYLGLVHDADGVEGALRRAGTARKFLSHFGISTECGLAQRTPQNIRQILQIEADTAIALDQSAAEARPS
jgi:methionine synthase II (cobalamin-independent)